MIISIQKNGDLKTVPHTSSGILSSVKYCSPFCEVLFGSLIVAENYDLVWEK